MEFLIVLHYMPHTWFNSGIKSFLNNIIYYLRKQVSDIKILFYCFFATRSVYIVVCNTYFLDVMVLRTSVLLSFSKTFIFTSLGFLNRIFVASPFPTLSCSVLCSFITHAFTETSSLQRVSHFPSLYLFGIHSSS